MPYCPQCGIDNPDSARYCDQCGAALIPVASSAGAQTIVAPAAPAAPAGISCPQCGAAAIPGEAFCDNCGAPLSAPANAQAANTPTVVAPTPPYSTGVPAQPVYPPPQPSSSATAPQSYMGVPAQTAAQPSPPISYSSPVQAQTAAQPSPPPISYNPPVPMQPPTHSPAPTLPPRHLPPLPQAAPRATLAPARLVVSSGAAIALPSSAQVLIGRADPVSKFYPDVDMTPYGALEHGVGRRHVRLFVQGAQIMIEDQDSTNGTLINGQKIAPRQPQPLREGDMVQLGKLVLRFHE